MIEPENTASLTPHLQPQSRRRSRIWPGWDLGRMNGNRFLRLNGVPTSEPPPPGEVAYLLDPMGAWRPHEGDHLYCIERECVAIHDTLASTIFGDIRLYYALLPTVS